jgi:hypothetical protein
MQSELSRKIRLLAQGFGGNAENAGHSVRQVCAPLVDQVSQRKGKEMNDFETWWYHEGSGPPLPGEDGEEHCKRMCKIAWSNGADKLLAVCQELEESASYWSEYDVPIGIVDKLKAAIASAKEVS